MGRGGSEGGTTPLCQGAWEEGVARPKQHLTLLLYPPDRLPEPTPEWPLPLPGPPAGPGRDIPRVISHHGHATVGCCQFCHHCLAAGEPWRERQVVGVETRSCWHARATSRKLSRVKEHSWGALCSQPHPHFLDSPAGLPPVPPAEGKESGLRVLRQT